MKFAFIISLLFFFTLKLSAYAHYSDTAKVLSPSRQADSLKVIQNVKLPKVVTVINNRTGSVKLVTDAKITDSLKALGLTNNHTYGINLLASTNNADRLIVPSALKEQPAYILSSLSVPDSLQAIAAKFTDSLLKAAINLKYMDSLKLIEAVHVDSIKKRLKFMGLDSLKLQLKANRYQSLKGALYSEIAARYLNYDTITNKKQRNTYQNEALSYTMLALHQFSSYNDTTGLRTSFDGLAKVYFSQKKYSQAKWFILQSNSLSRARNDIPNVISSLLTLATIKIEIKDYTLAVRDLNEALQLSETNHYKRTELDVLKNYAMLYSVLQNYPKEAIVLKKRDSLAETIKKEDDSKLLAILKAQTIQQNKKLDSLQKKKVYTSNIKKLYKSNSARRIASL